MIRVTALSFLLTAILDWAAARASRSTWGGTHPRRWAGRSPRGPPLGGSHGCSCARIANDPTTVPGYAGNAEPQRPAGRRWPECHPGRTWLYGPGNATMGLPGPGGPHCKPGLQRGAVVAGTASQATPAFRRMPAITCPCRSDGATSKNSVSSSATAVWPGAM